MWKSRTTGLVITNSKSLEETVEWGKNQSERRCVYAESLQSCLTLPNPMDCSPSSSYLWNFPGKNTGVGCHPLFQGFFPDSVLKPASPVASVLQVDSLLLSRLVSP